MCVFWASFCMFTAKMANHVYPIGHQTLFWTIKIINLHTNILLFFWKWINIYIVSNAYPKLQKKPDYICASCLLRQKERCRRAVFISRMTSNTHRIWTNTNLYLMFLFLCKLTNELVLKTIQSERIHFHFILFSAAKN